MQYPINQRAHQFNSIQSVPVSFGLWDTALKFLSPGPRNDVTDHLAFTGISFCSVKSLNNINNNFIFRFSYGNSYDIPQCGDLDGKRTLQIEKSF